MVTISNIEPKQSMVLIRWLSLKMNDCSNRRQLRYCYWVVRDVLVFDLGLLTIIVTWQPTFHDEVRTLMFSSILFITLFEHELIKKNQASCVTTNRWTDWTNCEQNVWGQLILSVWHVSCTQLNTVLTYFPTYLERKEKSGNFLEIGQKSKTFLKSMTDRENCNYR